MLVLTDISNEPDDEESLVRFLVYSNEYDVEGLVATTSTHLRERTRLDLVRRQVEAYGRVRANLLVHAPGFPSVEHLLAVAKTGQPGYGMAAVGEGRTTDGSRLILEAADRPDERPLWVSVWGGANTLAQALWDARRTRSAEEVRGLVRRLRVYAISDQDDAGAWLRREFPDLAYVVSPSTQDWKEYWRATWTGISGDRHYRNGPGHRLELVQNPWLEENVIRGHGPLGALYPRLEYIMEGDTPSFLGLVRNGLGWVVSPAWGGWGGRYAWYRAHGEERPTWTNSQDSRDTVRADDGREHTSDQATIWRWREHFQHDFAARMDWCVASVLRRGEPQPAAGAERRRLEGGPAADRPPGRDRSPLGRGDRGSRRPGRVSLLVRLPRGGDVHGRGRPRGCERHRDELRRAGGQGPGHDPRGPRGEGLGLAAAVGLPPGGGDRPALRAAPIGRGPGGRLRPAGGAGPRR